MSHRTHRIEKQLIAKMITCNLTTYGWAKMLAWNGANKLWSRDTAT